MPRWHRPNPESPAAAAGAGHGLPTSAPTVGVEEEFFLVDPTSERLTASNDLVVAAAARLGLDMDYELKRTQVEVNTPVCHNSTELRARVVEGRTIAAAAAREAHVGLLASGVSPTLQQLASVTDVPRYRTMAERYGRLVEEQEVCGCHVHVGVADHETAVLVCNHVRVWLPTLLAATANSPLHRGRDTGYASWRAIMASRWPCAGPPPRFTSAEHYDAIVAMMIDSGNILDPGMVYWDVRPSAHLPTVEVRVSDVPATVDETVLLAMLVLGPQLEETGDRRCAVAMWEAILARGTGAMLQRRAFARRHAVADVVGALRRAFVDGPQTPPLSGGAHPAPDVPAL